jgi:ATP-dependent Clp protease protease subunit
MADSYNDYPQSASDNAKRALKWVGENGWGTCGEATGKARANQLANREPISSDTIARMASFKRHQQHKDVPYNEGCGGLMWDAWGGTEGIEWAIRKLKQIDKKAQSKNMIAELNIVGQIDSFSNYNKQLVAEFLNQNAPNEVVINIASEGGSVVEGMAMGEMIANYKGNTIAKGLGFVASIATMLLVKAKVALVSKGTYIMIHNSWGMVEGNKHDLLKNAETMEQLDTNMLNAYLDKIKASGKYVNGSREQTKNKVRKLMDAETWLSAEQAIDLGLVDGYVENEDKIVKMHNEAILRLRAQATNYKNLPTNLFKMEAKKSSRLLDSFLNWFRAEEIEIEKELSIGEEEKNKDLDKMDEVVKEKDLMIQELQTKLEEALTRLADLEAKFEAKSKEVDEMEMQAKGKLNIYKNQQTSAKVENKYSAEQLDSVNAMLKQLFNKR